MNIVINQVSTTLLGKPYFWFSKLDNSRIDGASLEFNCLHDGKTHTENQIMPFMGFDGVQQHEYQVEICDACDELVEEL